MAKEGPAFYDQSSVFGWYHAKRDRPHNANNTLEKPVFDDLAGDLSDLRIPLMLFFSARRPLP